jgi:lipopolysaccharide heptosyltransferase I
VTLNPPKSVLIVRLSAIGDVIHALPVLDVLRQALPGARIGWLVEELSAPLLQGHPQLDKLYVIPKKRWRKNMRSVWRSEVLPFFQAIRADGWDVTLDLQGLSKSGLAAWGAGGKVRIGFAGANAREVNALLNNRRVRPQPSDVHVVQQNFRLLRGLGINPDQFSTKGMIGITEEERAAMKEKLAGVGWRGEPLVAINPGAGWSSKRWPPEHFGEVARLIAGQTAARPIVVWGPGEESMRDTIVSLGGERTIAAPNTRIKELAVLLSLTSLVIGGDTGPTHMAGPLGLPFVAIFGSSDELRNGTWPPSQGVLARRSDLACRPCWKTVCQLSGNENLACLSGLTPAAVFAEARKLLG